MAPTKKSTRKKSPSKKKKVTKKKVLAKKITKKKVVAKKITKKKASKAKPSAPRAKPEPAEDPRIERLQTLIKLMKKSKLGELSYEDSDIRVSLKQQGIALQAASGLAPAAASPAPAATPSSESASATIEDPDDQHVICSPFVGTFYSAPSPDSDAFTQIGQSVSKGQTVCIVEAMKLMNEIEAEVSGVVTEILVDDGQGVQYGEPLFKIKVS